MRDLLVCPREQSLFHELLVDLTVGLSGSSLSRVHPIVRFSHVNQVVSELFETVPSFPRSVEYFVKFGVLLDLTDNCFESPFAINQIHLIQHQSLRKGLF